jgi:hypothetical protein
MGISTDVNDPYGTENQRCCSKIRQGTWIVNQRVECALLGKRAKKG